MRELQPVNQNVLLELPDTKVEQTTASGIIIPDTAKEKPKFARVLAMSKIESPEISVGDVVFFKEYSGNEIALDGKVYLMLQYEDILGKLIETDEI
jgi:chaperonin GroES